MTRASSAPNPIVLLDDAFHLLRSAPASAWLIWAAGYLPFSLAMIGFVSEMTTSAAAAEVIVPHALGLAALFLWAVCCQALFSQRLWPVLTGETTAPRVRLTTILRTQALIGSTALIVLPLAAASVAGFPWAMAFYYCAAAFPYASDDVSSGAVARYAARKASTWTFASALELTIASMLALVVFINVGVLLIAGPVLLRVFTGQETVFSENVSGMLNSTLVISAFTGTWLIIDPLLRAMFVVRCFRIDAIRTGVDLKAILARCAVMIPFLPGLFWTGGFPGTRPPIVLRTSSNPGLHRVVLDVPPNPRSLAVIADPVVVGFTLPETLTRTAEHPISLTSRRTLECAKQPARGDSGKQEHMNVIRHQHVRAQLIMSQGNAPPQRRQDHLGNLALSQEHRPNLRRIEIPIHPDERFAGLHFLRWGITGLRKAAVQVAGYEQPSALRVHVRQTAAESPHMQPWLLATGTLKGVVAQRLVSAAPALVPALQAQSIEPQRLEKTIREITKRPEYIWREPRVAKPESRNAFITFTEDAIRVVRTWVERVTGWIGEAVRTILKWLFGNENELTPDEKGNRRAPWAGPLLYILCALIAGAGIALLLRVRLRRRPNAESAATNPALETVDLANEDVSPDQAPEDEWLALAARLFEAGDLRLATRALYLAVLAGLGRGGLITIHRAKSNLDYRRELARRARGDSGLQQRFRDIVNVFERTWYGGHSISADAFESFRVEALGLRADARA